MISSNIAKNRKWLIIYVNRSLNNFEYHSLYLTHFQVLSVDFVEPENARFCNFVQIRPASSSFANYTISYQII